MNNIPNDLRPIWILAYCNSRYSKNIRVRDLHLGIICRSLMTITSCLALKYSTILFHGLTLLYRAKINYLLSDLTDFHKKISSYSDQLSPSTNTLKVNSAAKLLQIDPAFNIQFGLLPPLDVDLVTEASGFQSLLEASQNNSHISMVIGSANIESEYESDAADGLNEVDAAHVSLMLQQSDLSIDLQPEIEPESRPEPVEQPPRQKRQKIREIPYDETISFSSVLLQSRHDEYLRDMMVRKNRAKSNAITDQALTFAQNILPLVPKRSKIALKSQNQNSHITPPVTPGSSHRSVSSIEIEREGQQHHSSVQSRMSSINLSIGYQSQTPSSRHSKTPSQIDNYDDIGLDDMDLDVDLPMDDDQISEQDSDMFLLLDLIPVNASVSVTEISKVSNLSDQQKSRESCLASTFYGLLWLAHQGYVRMIQEDRVTVHVQRIT